jgi:arabinan endo-1,5-alpha-L-arabinosidase
MKTWSPEKPVFDKAPQWATELIKGYWGHTWAPDIIYANGMWHLYYSCSTFGKNTSAIGLTVNKTLDPKSPDFKWEDRGLVISSEGGKNNWNAIDPNIIIDKKGTPWLNWGSFWDGIQLVKLQKDMQTPASDKSKTISRRHDIRKSKRGGNPVEAPFIIKRGKYFYLLVSFDYCCKGLQSNYKVAVGRSKKVEGPYKDKEGNLMEYGGGTIIAGPNEEYAGIGHCSAYEFNEKWYIVAHAYSKKHNGASKLYIKEMEFDKDGWPIIKE